MMLFVSCVFLFEAHFCLSNPYLLFCGALHITVQTNVIDLLFGMVIGDIQGNLQLSGIYYLDVIVIREGENILTTGKHTLPQCKLRTHSLAAWAVQHCFCKPFPLTLPPSCIDMARRPDKQSSGR